MLKNQLICLRNHPQKRHKFFAEKARKTGALQVALHTNKHTFFEAKSNKNRRFFTTKTEIFFEAWEMTNYGVFPKLSKHSNKGHFARKAKISGSK